MIAPRASWLRPLELAPALALALVVGASGLHAQEGLDATAAALARAWAASDVNAMGPLLEVRVHVALLDKDHGTLDRRNAVAAVGRFLERYPVRRAQLDRASEVEEGGGGSGFASIRWEAVAPGTSEAMQYTLFAGLSHDGQSWRIVELRVLP